MLTKSAIFTIDTNGLHRDINITPLFFRNKEHSWQPNEIYELTAMETLPNSELLEPGTPLSLGKIIVSDDKQWRYEGQSDLPEENIEQIASFVLEVEGD